MRRNPREDYKWLEDELLALAEEEQEEELPQNKDLNWWEEEEDGYWDMGYPPILYSSNPEGEIVPPSMPRPDATKVQDEKAELQCPTCRKTLRITLGVRYHRCPRCNKIFETPIHESKVQE